MTTPNRRSYSEEDLLSLLIQHESSIVERKTFSDVDGWLKTIVAFANSCPYYEAGVLFIGVGDDGTVQEMSHQQNLEELQKTVSRSLKTRVFPNIEPDFKTVRKAERECLAVIVHGSPKRPHVLGKVWTRKGPENIKEVTEQEYASMFAQRNNKVHRILQWRGQRITHEFHISGRGGSYFNEPIVEDCDEEYVTLIDGNNHPYTVPVRAIELSKDFERGSRLKIVEQRPS